MIPQDINGLLAAAEVRWHRFGSSAGGAGAVVERASTDTRSLRTGDLFIGLEGEHFDGARFAEAAAAAGAAAVVVGGANTPERRAELTSLSVRHDVAVGIADSGRAALRGVARATRARLGADVIGITGSCGKTSTKEILAAILAAGDEPEGSVVASPASFNNDVGVPLTLLSAGAGTRSLVVEIGTNAPGEIAPLTELAAPRVGILTMVGRSHLEGLGSVEGVVREKGALLAGSSDGCVMNLDCPHSGLARGAVPAGARLATTSASGDRDADLFARGVRTSPGGTVFVLEGELAGDLRGAQLEVPLYGAHAVQNVLSALAGMALLGRSFAGVPGALRALAPAPRRLAGQRIGELTVIDDTYNANPESVAAAIDVLERQAPAPGGRRLLVLGAMEELGADAAALHREAGERAAAAGIDAVLVVGPTSAHLEALAEAAAAGGAEVHRAEDPAAALDALRGVLGVGPDRPDVALVKASRASALDRLVDRLCATGAGREDEDRDGPATGQVGRP